MADQRSVFTILEDDSSAAGVKLPARAEGDAVSGNHVPAIIAKDSSGNYQLLQLRDQGDSAAGVDSVPVLPVKDSAGNLQLINARDEGDSVTGVDALPGLVAKDLSEQFAYLKVNADGELIVAPNGGGTKKTGYATVTPAAINTLTTVVDLSLTTTEIYESILVRGSSTFPVLWEVVQVDDAVITVKDKFLTGSGQFTFMMPYEQLEITAGASGTQAIRLRATQLSGSASDMHGYVEAIEKA